MDTDKLKLFVFASMFYFDTGRLLQELFLYLIVCTFVYLSSNPGPCCAMLARDVWHGQLAQAA